MTTARRFCRQHHCQIQRRDNGSAVLTGYGAVFYRAEDPGTEYELWSDLVERVSPTAFDRMLREQQDVRGLFNHDVNTVLGRVAAKTMRLSVDSVGLRYEIDVPDTSAGKDLAVSVERGDITGSSFSFIQKKVTYVTENVRDIRWLEDVDVMDVGPVTFPAYESTTAGVRSQDADALKREHAAWRAQRGGNHDADAVQVRLALLRLDQR